MLKDKPGSYMVYKPGQKPGEYQVFVEWRESLPITGHDGGMIFTYKDMADLTAARLGAGWTVIDVSQEECRRARIVLDALFGEETVPHE